MKGGMVHRVKPECPRNCLICDAGRSSRRWAQCCRSPDPGAIGLRQRPWLGARCVPIAAGSLLLRVMECRVPSRLFGFRGSSFTSAIQVAVNPLHRARSRPEVLGI